MTWLFPAIVATAGATLLMVMAYSWLWLEERKKFLALWIFAWVFYLGRFTAELLRLTYGPHDVFTVAEHGFTLLNGTLLLWGVYEFLEMRMPRFWFAVPVAGVTWVICALIIDMSFFWTNTPIFFLSGGIFLSTGYVILRARAIPGLGRSVVGWSFIFWGLHKFDFPILRPLAWAAPWGFLLSALLSVAVALGMLLIYFRYAKDQLARKEEQLRFLSNNIPNGAFYQHVSGLDGSIRCPFMSDGIERVLGLSAQDAMSDANRLRRLVYEEDLPRVRAAEAASLTSMTVFNLEFRCRTQSGEMKWIQCQSAPQRLPTGETIWNGFLIDITERKLAESALRASEEKYGTLLDNLNVGVFVSGLDGVFRQANPAIANMAGYESVEEFLATPAERLYANAEDRQRLIVELTGSGSVKNRVIQSVTKDGSRFWASLSAVLAPDEDGKPSWIHGFVENITDQKRVQDELQASEERFRLLFEQCPVGMVVTGLDYRFRMVNPHFCRMTGYSETELTSMTFKDLSHPDDVDANIKAAIELLAGEISHYQVEKRYVRKDGENIWVNLVVAPVRHKSGNLLHFFSMMQDITERKQAEAERLRLVAAIEQAAEAIEITDPSGVILYVNPGFERASGYSREEAVGRKSGTLRSGHDKGEFFKHVWDTISSGRVWTGHLINKRKDGSVIEEDATISPVKDASGNIVNYVAVKRDVTNEILLQKQLLESQKMEAVGTLAGGIAHDFNNLLQVIIGYSEMALFEVKDDQAGYAEFREIKKAARSAAELTQGLLAFSRRVESKLRPVNLNDELQHVVKMLARTLPKMIEIKMRLSEPLRTVNADPAQVQQVVMNLAVNARDAMPHGGELVIETQDVYLDREYCRSHLGMESGYYVLMSVSDSGVGMDRKTREHIFEPFYTTKETGKGTGLGLAIVFGIVKGHGGNILCFSEPGKGTTFTMYLPAFELGHEYEDARETEAFKRGTETILLVDDEEPLRQLGTTILNRFGYSVLTAPNGKEGLEVFVRERDRIALVILDLIMPEMSGGDCLKAILGIAPETKVIIASGYAADEQIERAGKSGAKGSVRKPYDAQQLLELVRNVLDEKETALE